MTDAGRFEVKVRVGPGVEADARSRTMEELNLLAQGRSAKQMHDGFLRRIRDVARIAARATVDQFEDAHDDRDLAVAVADAVVDAVLNALEAPAAGATEVPSADDGQEAQLDDRPQNTAHLRVGTWLAIDAVLDNAASVRVQGGVGDAEVAHANRLRERGWRANEQHPQRGLGKVGWPPDDELLSIELSGDDLRFILDRLDEAIKTTGHLASSLGSAESERRQCEQEVESLELVRDAIQAVDEDSQAEHP